MRITANYLLIYLLFEIFFISNKLQAQDNIPFPGLVIEQNSRHRTGEIRYLSGVNIRALDNSTISDIQGKFELIFSDKPRGNTVQLYARKTGMELVNIRELESATVLGRTEPLQVVMAPAGQLAQAQITYYQIAENALYSEYDRRLARLWASNQEKEAMIKQLSQETNQVISDLEKAQQVLQEQLNRHLEMAQTYTEEIARVNLDFASERYQEAITAFEKGNLQEILQIIPLSQSLNDLSKLQEEFRRIENVDSIIQDRKVYLARKKAQLLDENLLAARTSVIQFLYQRAEDHFQLALRLAPRNFQILVEYCGFLFDQNKYASLLSYADTLVNISGENPSKAWEAWKFVGLGYLNFRDYPKAEEGFQQSVQLLRMLIKKDSIRYQRDLAVQILNLATAISYNASIELSEKQTQLIPLYKEAISLLRVSFNDDSDVSKADLAYALIAWGEFQKDIGQTQNALSAINEALDLSRELYERDPTKYADMLGINLAYKGNFLLSIGNFNQAKIIQQESITLYRKLIEQNSERFKEKLGQDLDQIGNIYRQLGHYKEAMSAYDEAIVIFRELSKDSENGLDNEYKLASAHYNKAISLLEMEKYDAAILNAEQAIKYYAKFSDKYSSVGEAYRMIGLAYQINGKTKDFAKKYIRGHAEDFIGFSKALWTGSFFNGYGDSQSAISSLRLAYLMKPDDYYVNSLLGNVYYFGNDDDSAIVFFRRAYSIRPNSYESIQDLGKGYLMTGPLDSAILYLRKARLIKPNDYYTNYWLGSAYYQIKKYNSAQIYLNKAILLKPNSEGENIDLYDLLFRTYYYTEAFDSAKILLSQSKKLAEHLGSYWEKNINKELADSTRRLARTYQLAGKYDSALTNFQKSFFLEKLFSLDARDYATKIGIAQTYFLMSRFDSALVYLEDFYQNISPWTFAHSFPMAGKVYQQLRDEPTAHLFWAKADYWLGRSFYKNRAYDSAIVYLGYAQAIKPDDYDANFWLGKSHYRLGNYARAVPHFQAALRWKPDDAEAKELLQKAKTKIKN